MLHLIRHMTIYIQREGNCSMTKAFRYGLDVIPVLDADGSIEMAEVVEPEIRKADGDCPTLESLPQGFYSDVLPDFVREDKIFRILIGCLCPCERGYAEEKCQPHAGLSGSAVKRSYFSMAPPVHSDWRFSLYSPKSHFYCFWGMEIV